KMGSRLDEIADTFEADEEKIEYTAAADRCRAMGLGVKQWLGQELPEQVYWVEVTNDHRQRVTLASPPIEVGPALQQQLYSRIPSVILTSATLSMGGRSGFEHVRHRLGLEECDTLQLGSPFNYREQLELHLFRRMPDPATLPEAFEEEA